LAAQISRRNEIIWPFVAAPAGAKNWHSPSRLTFRLLAGGGGSRIFASIEGCKRESVCAAVDAEFIRVVEFLRANANQAAGVAARSVVLRPDLQANSINELPLLRRWLF
jgi:hypothetical protein